MTKLEDVGKFYNEGKEAYRTGILREDNPYTISTWDARHGLWRTGWNAASVETTRKAVIIVDKILEIF